MSCRKTDFYHGLLDPRCGYSTGGKLPPQAARFHLIALRPGTTKITAELFVGQDFQNTLEAEVQVAGLGDGVRREEQLRLPPRPVPYPEIVLRIRTEWLEDSACRFHYRLKRSDPRPTFIQEMEYHSDPFHSSQIAKSRELLRATVEDLQGGLPEDMRSRLTAFGRYLYGNLFPVELQVEIRNLPPTAVLILADQDARLPWELFHDGKRFLGERFLVGRWPWELDDQRVYEFPVGAVNVAYYANVEQPEIWADLLEPPGAPPPVPLPGGMFRDLRKAEVMRGLHLIRWGQLPGASGWQDAPARVEDVHADDDMESGVRPAKLSLRRNRPLVTLGYISAGRPELTTLEETWVPVFTRAGCSAFVGPLWAVQPAVEAVFTGGFYTALWSGASLGGAFRAGRQLAREVAPDSLDWMAYILFGDPMARPYRPVAGQGYAVVEAVGKPLKEPIDPGTEARFRITLRRMPPV